MKQHIKVDFDIDAVIAWVDGNDELNYILAGLKNIFNHKIGFLFMFNFIFKVFLYNWL